jgi:hypothetical protein
MRLKLRRNYVTLQLDDFIMDNGFCLQIFTKSSEAKVCHEWNSSNPYLSKKEFKRFLKEAYYKKIEIKSYSKFPIIYYYFKGDRE